MDDRELCNRYTADVFARLYRNFPVPISLDPSWIYEDLLNAGVVPSSSNIICRPTMVWLVESGYVRCFYPAGSRLPGAVLTAKGLKC